MSVSDALLLEEEQRVEVLVALDPVRGGGKSAQLYGTALVEWWVRAFVRDSQRSDD